MLWLLKVQLMHVPGIFRVKPDLLNMFDLTKLYVTVNNKLDLDTVS